MVSLLLSPYGIALPYLLGFLCLLIRKDNSHISAEVWILGVYTLVVTFFIYGLYLDAIPYIPEGECRAIHGSSHCYTNEEVQSTLTGGGAMSGFYSSTGLFSFALYLAGSFLAIIIMTLDLIISSFQSVMRIYSGRAGAQPLRSRNGHSSVGRNPSSQRVKKG